MVLYQATIPPEVIKASLKYLDDQTKEIILNWVIEANNPQNRVNKSDPIRYKLITDNESLKEAIALIQDAKVCGIDTETTGLDPHLHKLRLIQIASENNPTIIIDCYKCDAKLIQPLLINDSIKETRSCFIASPSYKLIIADYSQIELRIAAELTNDQKMLEAYNRGEDLHKLTASIILNKPLEEISKSDRQIAKSANFGLIYGASINGFRGYAESNYGISSPKLP